MATIQYEWRVGARITGVKADVAGEELERIRIEKGALTPADVVIAARPKTAPLHPAIFALGQKDAAEAWYQNEARKLIRAIVIVPTEADAPRLPAYVHIPKQQDTDESDGQSGRYEPVSVVIQRSDLFEEALRALVSKVTAAEEAVSDLKRAAEQSDQRDRLAEIAIVIQAFGAVREALAVLSR